MGFTYARIELVNADDQALVRRKLLPESKVRKVRVKVLVDSGASSIAINERIQKRLGLPLFRTGTAELADGSKIPVDVVGPVAVKFKRRETVAYAHVLPRNAEPLLGAIPLEDMDLVINPKKQKLDVNPASPDEPLIKIKSSPNAASA
jgi:clan AA aspartic protease